MTGLFGWAGHDPTSAGGVAARMGCALQSHAGERWAATTMGTLAVGLLSGPDAGRVDEWAAPVWTPDGRHALWLCGEIFAADGLPLDLPQNAPSRPVRAALLDRLVRRGPEALLPIDGEYQVAWWDAGARTLHLLTDRFAGLPWYWAASPSGVAFACGVRGVLMAPGIAAAPDLEALREAVTFGGFRLGGRTNVAGVTMMPAASHLTVDAAGVRQRRYWTWDRLHTRPVPSVDAALEEAHALWRQSVARRLQGAARPGQTLSGGLDSRAILAEAAPRVDEWAAITYGVPGCEDGAIAARAARAVGARWQFRELYQGDWLSARAGFIQHTDGLMQLADLLHLEALPDQRASLDVHLSGYVGDAVAGPTFGDVGSPEAAAVAMPFYGCPLSLPWDAALDRLASMTSEQAWLASPALLFEHKLPQSTNRWTAAWRPWLRVRKPFMDYAFFDHHQTLPRELRVTGRFYEHWLRRFYPAAFGRLPNHKTGAPVLASPWQIQAARARRLAHRSWLAAARRLHVPHRPWSRYYADEPGAWGQPDARARIEATIGRSGSLAHELFGVGAVEAFLLEWFERENGPTQVVGALYTFEAYFEGLAAHLRGAEARAGSSGAGLVQVERRPVPGDNGGATTP